MKDAITGAIKIGDAYVDLGKGGVVESLYRGFYGSGPSGDGFKNKKIKKQWEIQKVINHLARIKYIKLIQEKQKIYLTEKGISEFIKFKAIRKKEEWDGKWRIVIFDVSEERRNNRDFLRKQLKWIGFKELQKSVWVFPFDVRKDIEDLMEISKYKCKGDVRFLVAEKIEEDNDLKKWFDLK
jgi:DNA-binding transcriptional regulator PaaX